MALAMTLSGSAVLGGIASPCASVAFGGVAVLGFIIGTTQVVALSRVAERHRRAGPQALEPTGKG
ncbi:MAG: hypothetical protein LC624_08705 [Halobacteriales archaeon]|nr:hypothetical protein [Halobacteriales archaeon]